MSKFHIRSTSHTYAEFLKKLDGWIRDDLPRLNEAVETGSVSPTDFVACVQSWINEAYSSFAKQPFDRPMAFRLIQLLGFLVSSAEKHFQDRKAEPGTGLALLNPADELLVALAQIACHPPRDTQYTYWKQNNVASPLTFTGSNQEVFFNYAVNQTDEFHTASCIGLRQVCNGYVDVISNDAIEVINQATQNMKALHKIYGSFMTKNEDGQQNLDPMFFMKRMRTYLPAYPVKGVMWDGVNAANTTSQMQVDYLIGTVNADYFGVVEKRLRYLVPEDQLALKADIQLPSLFNQILQVLKLTVADVDEWNSDLLGMYLIAQPPSVRNVLVAYRNLVSEAGGLSAMHWALIKNYLIKPAAKMTEAEKAHMAVNPDGGTGKAKHSDTEKIMRMRHDHPTIGKFLTALKGGQYL
ncbi:MAG: DUF1864 family protein [Chloroflexi bacterium]|nr:DUF1864 family protein [Chloroflexota bacterium]